MTYVFDDGPVRLRNSSAADPEVIGAELLKIADINGGSLEPERVVEAAKAKSHPLHDFFEWDDKKAGHAHRVNQARSLIRIVRIERPDMQEPVRAFFSVKSDTGNQTYRPVDTILKSADMQMSLLKSARRDLDAFTKRYRVIGELCEPIAEAIKRIDRRISEAEGYRASA